MAELKRTELSVRQEKAVLVGVILPGSTADPRDPLGELASLAKTAGAKVVGNVLQRRQRVDSGTYIGSGKVVEVAKLAKKEQADVIIFDNDLSPAQVRDLEEIAQRKVLDRSELILDIFACHARTKAACRWSWRSLNTPTRACGICGRTWSGWPAARPRLRRR